MVSLRNIHWQTPTVILSCFLAGILFAIAHHVFYQNLEGTVVHSSHFIFGLGITPQRLNIAIGNVFALLVASCLTSVVSTVYIQLVWKSIRSQPAQLSVIDTLFYGNKSPTSLLSLELWRKHYGLAILAAALWLLSVATLVTPATLTVESRLRPPNSSTLHVPNIDFKNPNFAHFSVVDNRFPAVDAHYLVYQGPQTPLLRLVNSVSASGQIPQLDPPGQNTSWSLDFYGPSLTCGPASDDLRSMAKRNAQNAWSYAKWKNRGDSNIDWWLISPDQWQYLSWPVYAPWENRIQNDGINEAAPFTPWYVKSSSDISRYAFRPDFYKHCYRHGRYRCESGAYFWVGIHPFREQPGPIIECRLQNSSYHVDISYSNGVQSIRPTINQTLNDVHPIKSFTYPVSRNGTVYAPLSVNGSFHPLPPNGSSESDTVWMSNGHIVFNPNILETTAYQAIFEAFGGLLTGYMVKPGSYKDFDSNWLTSFSSSRILSTALADTNELAAFRKHGLLPPNHYWFGDIKHVYTVEPEVDHGEPLAQTMETLFRNVTVSLMTSPYFQPNYSSPDSPDPVNVTFQKIDNIYAYSSYILWLGYGLAIFFSFLVALLGFQTIYVAEASFSDRFSSALRVACHADLTGGEVNPQVTDGSDPLPDHLERIVLKLPPEKSQGMDEVRYKMVIHRPSLSTGTDTTGLTRRNLSGDRTDSSGGA